jgi:hypothetical protein
MKNWRIEIKWGIIFVIAGLAWVALEKMLGLHSTRIDQQATLTNLFIIPAVVIYWLALKEKRTSMGGSISFKQAFISGLVITLVVTLFTPLQQYITQAFISPDYFKNVSAYAVETKMMTSEEAADYFTLNNYILQSLVFAPLAGVITSLLVAWLVSRKKKTA